MRIFLCSRTFSDTHLSVFIQFVVIFNHSVSLLKPVSLLQYLAYALVFLFFFYLSSLSPLSSADMIVEHNEMISSVFIVFRAFHFISKLCVSLRAQPSGSPFNVFV